jgi:hypothetical protein
VCSTAKLDRSYPLEQAPEAMRRLEAGDVRGKVAITLPARTTAQPGATQD